MLPRFNSSVCAFPADPAEKRSGRRSEMGCGEKYDLSNFGIGRRREHAFLCLLSREIATDDEPAHAVRDDVDL